MKQRCRLPRRPRLPQLSLLSLERDERLKMCPDCGHPRYRERGINLYFRADAAFAKPEIYERLEQEGIQYAIRLPANDVLQRRIGHLLTRPVGRPPKKPIISFASFRY